LQYEHHQKRQLKENEGMHVEIFIQKQAKSGGKNGLERT
jgi:hypothetical protein